MNTKPTHQAIETISISSLLPWEKNARTHSKKQVKQIAESIKQFGFTNPVLIDGNYTILAGHGRVEAAKLLGWHEVPCLRIEHMTAQQKRAYVLADNKLALNVGWDEDLLAEELQALLSTEDLSFDIGITGFSIAEVDKIIEGVIPEEDANPADDNLPDIAENQTRCAVGDVWQLGQHRLICGNALDPEVIALLMQGEQAQMVFTDPPYNVPIDGHVGGAGKIKHPEFAMASGEMSSTQFIDFLRTSFENRHKGKTGGLI